MLRDTQSKENKKKAFEVLWSGFPLFRNFTLTQLGEISEQFKILPFAAGTELVQKGEPVEWLGIILSGTAAAKSKDGTFEILTAGDMIGAMGTCGLHGNEEHKFGITGTANGFVAVITIMELKAVMRTKSTIV